jgi:hypothetical protein
MNERLERVRGWVAARGLPFEPALARMSDRLDDVLRRRERSKEGDKGESPESDESEDR